MVASKPRLQTPSAVDLYLAFCNFGVGRCVSEVLTTFRSELVAVDDRKFITFGVVQSLIRRVHECVHVCCGHMHALALCVLVCLCMCICPSRNVSVWWSSRHACVHRTFSVSVVRFGGCDAGTL